MNRRQFVGRLLGAVTGLALAPTVKYFIPAHPQLYVKPDAAGNFYGVIHPDAMKDVIDQVVMDCAKELGYRAATTLDAVIAQAYVLR